MIIISLYYTIALRASYFKFLQLSKFFLRRSNLSKFTLEGFPDGPSLPSCCSCTGSSKLLVRGGH